MAAVENIISAIQTSMKSVAQHVAYPNRPGLYAFSLAKGSVLKEFGKAGQIIYVGKAEDSLRQRDLHTHFKDGKTGHSTLRRSIGAILKTDFKATALSRNGTLDAPNIDNYKFDAVAETKLTRWMQTHLLIGYWEYNAAVEKRPLRDIEAELIMALKPTLDLDRRTRQYNVHAEALSALRQVCKDEARSSVMGSVENHLRIV